MALPTTITGIDTVAPCVGPFISSGGNVYFVGLTTSPNFIVRAMKATDPTSSFSAVGTDPGAASNLISGYQVGDVIHVVSAEGASTIDYKYHKFDMSSDSWTITGESIATGLNTNTSGNATQFGNSVVVRSGGEVVAFFNGARVANMGNSYSQTYYSRRTGVNTWTAATQVSAGGQVDFTTPEAALGASDSVHFMYYRLTATTAFNQRTLNSSNTLQTNGSTNITNAQGSPPDIWSSIAYNNGGTTKVVNFTNLDTSSTNASCGDFYFDSGNTPTLNYADIPSSTEIGVPNRAFNDGTDVWAMYRSNADSDLYVRKSTDNGATWGSATSAFTGTVSQSHVNLSHDGNIFTRSGSVVIPYVVNDNGTLKYNEYVVRTIAADTLHAQIVM